MDTLVLSVNWRPYARVSWMEAVVLYLKERVEIVESYVDRMIRSPSLHLPMPSVCRFVSAVKNRRKVIKFSRLNVFARDGGRCQYCSVRLRLDEATYDHVVPKARGGKTDWDNVVICCLACNQAKGCRTPEQSRMVPRTAPVKPKKLPELRQEIRWTPGMPDSWKTWLTDQVYWTGALET